MCVVTIRRASILVVVLSLALAEMAGFAVAGSATTPPPPAPPPVIPKMPKGSQTRCTTTGPAWSLWGVHTPNAPPRHGNKYLVTAWGIPCIQARTLVRAFFPKVPAYSTGKLSGGPKGFTCKGGGSGLMKNRMYAGSCIRLAPATLIGWGPTGGKVG